MVRLPFIHIVAFAAFFWGGALCSQAGESPKEPESDASVSASTNTVAPSHGVPADFAFPDGTGVYRLDDHLDEALHIDATEPAALGEAVRTLFPAPEGIEWGPSDGEADCEVRDGVLHFRTTHAGGLINTGDLGLFGPQVESIILRLKVSGTDEIALNWVPSGLSPDFQEEGQQWSARIPIQAPDELVEYRVRVHSVNPLQMRWIRYLRLTVEGPASMEVHAIEAHSRGQIFAGSAVGVRQYRIENEMRPCLYAHCPASVEYEIAVPPQARFATGMNAVGEGGPVTFSVQLQAEDRVEKKLSREILPDSGWHEAAADLSDYAGETVRIILQVEGGGQSQVGLWSSPMIYRPRTPNADETRPNILLYIVDALRADLIGVYGHEHQNAPHLQALSAEGVRFNFCRTQETCTKPSMTSLAIGRDKMLHGFNCSRGLSVMNSLVTFPELLRAAGYVTAVCSENPLTPPPTPNRHAYDHVIDLKPNHQARENDTFAEAVKLLQRYRDRPFMLYIHTMECHGQQSRPCLRSGFRPPPGLQHLWDRPHIEFGRDRYEMSIAVADHNFGRVLEQLAGLGLSGNTAVLFTSDHGEGFKDHYDQIGHGHAPFEEQVRVPLIMRWPGVLLPGKVIEENVQLIDLTPTILEIAGLPPCPQFRGLSLLDCAKSKPAAPLPQRPILSFSGWENAMSISKGSWKLMIAELPELTALFDLAQDPKERHDASAAHPEVRASLEATLLAHCREEQKEHDRLLNFQQRHVHEIEPDKVEAIKALGYLD